MNPDWEGLTITHRGTVYIWRGPCKIDCAELCEVPKDTQLCEVPVPRHNWSDVLICPNDGCDRAFLIKATSSS